MKKFLLGLALVFCFALPYAAQAQVIVAVGLITTIIITTTTITTSNRFR